jgi:adenylate cyclase class IV
MPENVELKARFSDLSVAEGILADIGAGFEGVEKQVDTYFVVPRGRLKLREIEGSSAELIFYERVESGDRRDCLYHICRFDDPADLRFLLDACLGRWIQVKKVRRVYRFENVKINLDDVEELGSFIEFEAAVQGDPDAADDVVRDLVNRFGIDPGDIVLKSYSDLVSGS